MTAPVHIRTVVSMPFEENTYIVWSEGRTDAVVFDPGLEPELDPRLPPAEGLTVAAILNTHGHADHIGGNQAMKEAYPHAPLIIGIGDTVMLGDANANPAPLPSAYRSPVRRMEAARLPRAIPLRPRVSFSR